MREIPKKIIYAERNKDIRVSFQAPVYLSWLSFYLSANLVIRLRSEVMKGNDHHESGGHVYFVHHCVSST